MSATVRDILRMANAYNGLTMTEEEEERIVALYEAGDTVGWQGEVFAVIKRQIPGTQNYEH